MCARASFRCGSTGWNLADGVQYCCKVAVRPCVRKAELDATNEGAVWLKLDMVPSCNGFRLSPGLCSQLKL